MNNLVTRLLLETGAFDSNIKKARSEIRDFQNVCGNIAGTLTKVAGVFGLAVGGAEAFSKAMKNNEQLADAFASTQLLVNTAVNHFFNSITTGSFDNFLKGLRDTIKLAKDAYLEIDRLGTMKSFNTPRMAELERDRVKQESIIRDTNSTEEQVAAAKDALKKIEAEKAKYRLQEIEQNLAAYYAEIRRITGLNLTKGSIDSILKDFDSFEALAKAFEDNKNGKYWTDTIQTWVTGISGATMSSTKRVYTDEGNAVKKLISNESALALALQYRTAAANLETQSINEEIKDNRIAQKVVHDNHKSVEKNTKAVDEDTKRRQRISELYAEQIKIARNYQFGVTDTSTYNSQLTDNYRDLIKTMSSLDNLTEKDIQAIKDLTNKIDKLNPKQTQTVVQNANKPLPTLTGDMFNIGLKGNSPLLSYDLRSQIDAIRKQNGVKEYSALVSNAKVAEVAENVIADAVKGWNHALMNLGDNDNITKIADKYSFTPLGDRFHNMELAMIGKLQLGQVKSSIELENWQDTYPSLVPLTTQMEYLQNVIAIGQQDLSSYLGEWQQLNEIFKGNALNADGTVQILSDEDMERFTDLNGKILSIIGGVMGANDVLDELGQRLAEISKKADSLGYAADMVNNLGSAFTALGSAFENKDLQIAGIIALAIAQIMLSYATALTLASAAGPIAWAAFGIAGLAQVAAMVAQIHQISGYANGGIVGGNSYVGDKNLVRVNSGEMILNGTQQRNLFNLLDSGGSINGGTVEFKVKGKDLVTVLNNYNNQKSRVL